MEIRRTALYARVSTNEQNPDAQLGSLRAYADRRGVEVVEFVDHGVSGRRSSRPALDAMLDAARRREIDTVVVVRLDRIARSLVHMAQLGEELRQLGVELVSLTESIDTSSSTGRALFGMCGVFAQLEADIIRERTLAGLALARRRGKKFGRPLVTDRRQQARILRLRRSGHSIRAIAKRAGVARTTVTRVIGADR